MSGPGCRTLHRRVNQHRLGGKYAGGKPNRTQFVISARSRRDGRRWWRGGIRCTERCSQSTTKRCETKPLLKIVESEVVLVCWRHGDNSTSHPLLASGDGGPGGQRDSGGDRGNGDRPCWPLDSQGPPRGLERFQPRLVGGAHVAGTEPSHRRLK